MTAYIVQEIWSAGSLPLQIKVFTKGWKARNFVKELTPSPRGFTYNIKELELVD